MTTKDIMILATNKNAMEMINKLASLSEDNKNGKNKEQIEVLAMQIHNEIVITKMNLYKF